MKRVVCRIFYREVLKDPYPFTEINLIHWSEACGSDAERDRWKADENGF